MSDKCPIKYRPYYKTRNCVVCGHVLEGTPERPSCFSGHVLIDNTIKVVAGACYGRRCDKKKDKWKSVEGCYGAWKPKYGVVENN